MWSVGNTIVAETTIAGKHVTFVASASVMNLNGSTLFSCLSRLHYSVPNSNLLIVYDEINVPVVRTVNFKLYYFSNLLQRER